MLLTALGAFPPAALAQGDDLAGRSPWELLAQAVLSLAVVVGVIYLVYFGLRRLTERRGEAGADGPIRVVQAQHLGGDRWVYLVEVEGRRLVVGGAAGHISRIAELEPSGGEGRDEV
jgi:flagellar biogenesis protein FliO